jgi:D-3-phosphoglycerate dehydrogenase
VKAIEIEYAGEVGKLTTAPVSISVLKGLLQHQTEEVNLVNARVMAEDRGIKVSEAKAARSDEYASLLRVAAVTEKGKVELSGTVFAGSPRVVSIDGFPIEAELSGGILLLKNQDVPGVVGRLGTFLGDKGINIAGLQLGRIAQGGTAVSLINVDNVVPAETLEAMKKLPNVTDAKFLTF